MRAQTDSPLQAINFNWAESAGVGCGVAGRRGDVARSGRLLNVLMDSGLMIGRYKGWVFRVELVDSRWNVAWCIFSWNEYFIR